MVRPLLATLVLATGFLGCSSKSSTQDTASDTASGTVQADQDKDHILDVQEGCDPTADDLDKDGIPNCKDTDSDGDGILDSVEAGDADPLTLPVDSDGDGIPDFLDLDSDNNCIPDATEAGRTDGTAVDSDGDGIPDYADADNDNDGILDTYEIGDQAKCKPPDTDGDGTPDYMDTDSDNDGICDLYESGTTEFNPAPVDTDGDGIPDFQDTDSDGDGISDRDESGLAKGSACAPPRDTDGDGIPDFKDTDSDGDGLSDYAEVHTYSTDPYDSDSDGDGFSDGSEVLAGTNPLDAGSVIEGVYVDLPERTDVEQEFDFQLRITQGDLAMVCDTTCSMSGTIGAVQKSFITAIKDVSTTIPDMAGAAGQHKDYNDGIHGGAGDKPFFMSQAVTTDFAAVQTAVNTWTAAGGGDGPEGSMESLYQAATGQGYDQNCNGVYDAGTDMLPFLSSATDPFGGAGGENWSASDAGNRGGFGFRTYSLPVIVLATDNYMRDPDSTNVMYNGVPGGCPLDAGNNEVVTAFTDLGAYFIGVDVSGLPTPQMTDLATRTNSMADMNGDGVPDPLVFRLDETKPGFETTFSDYVVSAIQQLVQVIKFHAVSLQVGGDTYGFVTGIDPTGYDDIDTSTTTELPFTISFRGVVAATKEDQLFLLTLNVIGDGTTLLDSKDIVIRVPGVKY